MSDADRWDRLAQEKGPMRAAWDEDFDRTEKCVNVILSHLPINGMVYDIGCGPARLAAPILVAAYSVLAIQHVSEDTFHHWFEQLGENLPALGTFIFQFCEGAGDHFKMTTEWAVQEIIANEMFVQEVHPHLVMDSWTWVIARKL